MDVVREVALKIIYKIDKEKAYSNIVLDETIKEYRNKLDDRDIGFISELVYGIITWKLTLDEIIKKNFSMDFEHIKNGNLSDCVFR